MAAFSSIAAGLALAASAAGAGIAGAKKKKAERKQRKLLSEMNEENENMFLRDYYRDFMDDPSSRAYLKRIEKNLYDKDEGIENSAIATGATHENILARKQANNEVMSDAINNVVINNEQKKEVAKDRYLGRKDAITSGKMDMIGQSGEQQAQNWSALGSNMADSIAGLASSYIGKDLFKRKITPDSPLSEVTDKSRKWTEDYLKDKEWGKLKA